MNTRYLMITLLVFMSSLCVAQDRSKGPNVAEMHERKWQFMVEQTKLSASQAELVHPIFLEYENTLWKQHSKNRDFFQSVKNRDKNSKPDYQALNDRYADSELFQAQQFKIYHLKLRKILDPETLFRYYKAERDFKRKLLKDFPGRGKDHKE